MMSAGGSRVVRWFVAPLAALSEQRVSLRGHNEVVSVEPADLVGPPAYRDTPPLGEQSGMMTLLLCTGADPVGEGQRAGEGREVEDPLEPGDAVALQKLQSGIWDLSSATSAAVARGESSRQATHRSTDSVLIACTSLPGSIVLREGRVHPSRPPRSLPDGNKATRAGCVLRGSPPA